MLPTFGCCPPATGHKFITGLIKKKGTPIRTSTAEETAGTANAPGPHFLSVSGSCDVPRNGGYWLHSMFYSPAH
jgi:hypothetical protein